MKQRLLNPQAARRLIAALLLLFMTLPLAWGDTTTPWKGEIADQIEEGEGTAEKPILIKTAAELAYFAQQVNAGGLVLKLGKGKSIDNNDSPIGKYGFLGYYFALSNNINLNGIDWTPIGLTPYNNGNTFRGHFDGKGYCIEGLTVGSENNQYTYAGLFGYVQNGSIQNLGVRLAGGIWGSGYAGGIVGRIESNPTYPATLRNCYVEGPGVVMSKGQSSNCAGGIAGSTEGTNTTLSHCYAIVDVEASGGSSGSYAGGIAGYGSGNISYTYATGSVRASGGEYDYAGGICGRVNQKTTLSNSLALNKEIEGGNDRTHRVTGYVWIDYGTSLTNNYASPEIYVNGKPANSQNADEADGSDEGINLSNYITQLGSSWVNNNADLSADLSADPWDSSNKSLLPKLRIVASDDGQGNLTYGDWTNSTQPDLQATNYLIATEIENDGGNADSGNSWANPIYIANRAELAYLAQQVNAGGDLTVKGMSDIDGASGFSGYYFALSNDINLAQYHWTPIGIAPTQQKYFCGHFDGKGHCIEGLRVGSENNQYLYAGLFGYVKNGTIQNLGVRLAGGIWGSGYAGGIVGRILSNPNTSATLRNCYVEGPGVVMSKGDQNNYAGGIAGSTEGTNTTLSHCYATVDVEASGGSINNNASGIAGYGSGKISYTYATGSIRASGGEMNRAGGICGYVNRETTLSNSLALNKEIEGDSDYTHRVAGEVFNATLTNNYASLQTRVNNAPVYNQDLASWDGSDAIHIEDYEKALKTDVTDVSKQPWVLGGTTHLPKLNVVMSEDKDDPQYAAWPVTTQPAQPTLLPADYLPAKFTLHIVTPTGGSMTVKDGAGNEIQNEAVVYPGTTLTLSYIEDADYEFVRFLSGNGQDNLTECNASLTMSESDLWVSAEFKEKPKPEPEPDPTPDPPYVPVYFTVTLPSVEGATTDPAPGDYKVESWDNFRFYLTLNPDYSESQPVVTTSRGETIQPRKSDGAYLVKYVRSDVQLFIDGIQLNNPTANADIEADALRIYAVGSTLMISAPRTAEAMVCDLSGRLLRTCNILPGLTRIEGLRAGIYIVKVNGAEGVKVVIR